MTTHPQPLSVGEHAGQGGGAGDGRGLEGQAEVLAHNSQTGQGHKEGVVTGLWSWPIWIQTPALPLASCAALGRLTNFSVLQFPT